MTACYLRWLAVLAFLPAAAFAQTPDKQIVVTGKVDVKKSEWKRAETDHVIVFSEGDAGELKRVTRNLEALHLLMTRLYRRGDTSDDAAKVRVTLIGTQERWRALHLTALRAQEGPFTKGFAGVVYYDPREDGDVIAVTRSDTTIALDTDRREEKDCEDFAAGADTEGGLGTCGASVDTLLPIARPWEAALYSAFAQHFILTYQPAAYPRWYLDGIGALFSTVDVKRDGALDYAISAKEIKMVFGSYGYPNVGDILTGRYLVGPQKPDTGWSPYTAWLLTHYFVYSKLKPERRQQFDTYMADIRRGVPQEQAAAVFGDMKRMQRDIVSYADSQFSYAHADRPTVQVPDPLVTTLSRDAGALVEARVEMDSRLAALPASIGTGWVDAMAEKARQAPDDMDTQLLAAQAECRAGRAGDCLATAARVLATAPDNVEALAWKGVALTEQAMLGPKPARAALLVDARKPLERAIAVDGRAPLPQIAYFATFEAAGETPPPIAMRGLANAIRSVPAAPGPRLLLGQELVREGQVDAARMLLQPVLYGGYDSPEKAEALKLIPQPAK